MIGIIFSIVLFFLAIFYLVKQVLVTAAALMGFSLLWFIVGARYRKFELTYFYATKDKGGSNS